MKKNFYLDLLLFLSGLICILTGIVLDFHLFAGHGNGRALKGIITAIDTYSGYIMAAGLLFHLIWHWKWIKAAAGKSLTRANGKQG